MKAYGVVDWGVVCLRVQSPSKDIFPSTLPACKIIVRRLSRSRGEDDANANDDDDEDDDGDGNSTMNFHVSDFN